MLHIFRNQPFLSILPKSLQGIYGLNDSAFSQFKEAISNIVDSSTVKPVALKVAPKASLMSSNNTAAVNRTVAVIPVKGILMKDPDWISMYIYGVTSMMQIMTQIQQCVNDESVCAIVLDYDSPGGSVDGCELMATAINNAKAVKPVIAYSNYSICSAAYWGASQCDAIILDGQSSFVGSIGVMCTLVSYAGYYQANGIEVSYIAAPQSTDKIVAPDNQVLSDADKAKVEADLKMLASIFIDAVKASRQGVDTSCYTGDTYFSTEAVKLGLADSVGSLDDAITAAFEMADANNSNNNQSNKQAMNFPKLKAALATTAVNGNITLTAAQVAEITTEAAALDGKVFTQAEVDAASAAASSTATAALAVTHAAAIAAKDAEIAKLGTTPAVAATTAVADGDKPIETTAKEPAVLNSWQEKAANIDAAYAAANAK